REIAVGPGQAGVRVIEDAPLSLEHRQPRCGVGAIDVAEESLENRARIVLDWQRRGLAAPRDGVGVGAAIAAVAIAGELVIRCRVRARRTAYALRGAAQGSGRLMRPPEC